MSVFCVDLFQSLHFMFHFHLPGFGVKLRQPLAFPRMFHLQFKQLQILELPTEIINQLQTKQSVKHNSNMFHINLFLSYLVTTAGNEVIFIEMIAWEECLTSCMDSFSF